MQDDINLIGVCILMKKTGNWHLNETTQVGFTMFGNEYED